MDIEPVKVVEKIVETFTGTCSADANCTDKETVRTAITTIVEKDDPVPRRVCDSLIMCIITAVNEGLRNGGGIGDVLRKPDIKEPLFVARVVYDMLFFFIIIIIALKHR